MRKLLFDVFTISTKAVYNKVLDLIKSFFNIILIYSLTTIIYLQNKLYIFLANNIVLSIRFIQ